MTEDNPDDYERAHRLGRPMLNYIENWRASIRHRPVLNTIYRGTIVFISVVVVVIGLILVPLPGPGWLIVFIGLTIMGSEFRWARRFTNWLRAKLEKFWTWWRARRAARAEKKRTDPK